MVSKMNAINKHFIVLALSSFSSGFMAVPRSTAIRRLPWRNNQRRQFSGQRNELTGSSLRRAEPPCTVLFRNTTVEAAPGTTLRTALLKAGVTPHNGESKLINCRGLGTCGTCAVEITRGTVQPPVPSPRELVRLNFPPHSRSPANAAQLRLACQCTLVESTDAQEVTKYDGFWGQDLSSRSTEPASEFKTYFGELEFVLDGSQAKRPDKSS